MHTLTLFTDSMCLSRLSAPTLIKKVLEGVGGVCFEEKDLAVHSKDARRAGARFSPTLVLDEKVLCVGIPEEDELRQWIRRAVEEDADNDKGGQIKRS